MKPSREEDDDARITLPFVDEKQKENRQQFQGQYLLDERNRLFDMPPSENALQRAAEDHHQHVKERHHDDQNAPFAARIRISPAKTQTIGERICQMQADDIQGYEVQMFAPAVYLLSHPTHSSFALMVRIRPACIQGGADVSSYPWGSGCRLPDGRFRCFRVARRAFAARWAGGSGSLPSPEARMARGACASGGSMDGAGSDGRRKAPLSAAATGLKWRI